MRSGISVVSIQVAKPQAEMFRNKEVMTAFRKRPVEGPVRLAALNLEGDKQADLVHHGGPDKAVCCYPAEHFAYWERELGKPFGPGAFGENLTLQGVLEPEVCIGDVFELGEAAVQVTEARIPCFKTAMRHGVDDMALRMKDTGYTGFYLRVLKEGMIEAGQELRLVERHPLGVTAAFCNQIRYHDEFNVDGLRRILAVNELSEAWRESLEKRLAKALEG